MLVSMVKCVEHVHSKGYLHRNLKDTHFRVNSGQRVFVLDFGLAKKYLDGENTHVKHTYGCKVLGDSRFNSQYVMSR